MTETVQPRVEDFTGNVPLPGRTLYAKVWGSWSHNTQVPESDVDYLAVFQYPTRDIVRLSPPPDTIDGEKPDYQAHEIAKFCALLRKGNPGIVEMLFTERDQIVTPAWAELITIRDAFINMQTLRSYIGYCEGQLQRLRSGTRLHTTGGEYNTKWAYHLVRLAFDAERIAAGNPPVVFKEGVELDTLMAVRARKYTPGEIEGLFRDAQSRIEALRPQQHLAELADASLLDDWLWARRLEYLE
jgi:predicted nucleotidyltransferase